LAVVIDWPQPTGVPALLGDVVTEQLSRASAVPDTGSLPGDLERYAVQAARDAAGPLVIRQVTAATRGLVMRRRRRA
jgi:hypothetical protein